MKFGFKRGLTGSALLIMALAGCGETATPTPASSTSAGSSASANSPTDAYPLFATYQGHYAGTWNNTTYGSSGSMTWDISVDSGARTASITVNAAGNVFGGSGAPAETIKLTGLATGSVTGPTNSFGTLSGTITPGGAISIKESTIPGGSIDHVTATGQFSGNNKITLQYTVYFAGGGSNATGTVTLNKS